MTVAVAFAVWFGCTILAQFSSNRLSAWLLARDEFGLLPNWLFFAPNPISYDLAILARHANSQDATGDATWFLVYESPYGLQPFRRSVWHPEARLDKAIHDLAEDLLRNKESQGHIELTPAYLCFLNYTDQAISTESKHYFQFALLRYTETDSVDMHGLVFVSKIHRHVRAN